MSVPDYFLSDKQIINVLALTQVATAIHITEDAIIQTANQAMLRIWGKDDSVIGKSLEEALPELKGQPFIDLFKRVWNEGLTISGTDTPADLLINGQLATYYFDFEYRAVKDDAGRVYCILHTATDVTDRVMGRQAIEQAEQQQAAYEREQALNEELASSNEELNAINEELYQSQHSLYLLNNELEGRVAARTKDLYESQTRLQNILDTMAEGLAIVDKDGRITYMNPAGLRIVGFSMDEITTRTYNDRKWQNTRLDGSSMPKEEHPLAIMMATGKTVSSHEVGIKLPGSDEVFYLSVTAAPLLDEQGNITGGISTFMDVTRRRKEIQVNQDLNDQLSAINEELTASNEEARAANEELRLVNDELHLAQTNLLASASQLAKSEETLRLAVESARIGTWYTKPDTNLLEYNNMLATIFGYEGNAVMTYDQVIGQITDDLRDIIVKEMRQAAADYSNYDITCSLHRFNDNKLIWIRSLGKANRTSEGSTLFSGVIIDITEQKQDEQRKNDFIGMASHELKTPLTSLNGYLQMLQGRANKAGDAFTGSALAKSVNQIKKMTTLINGFLNVSRLESGKINIDRQLFDMAVLIKEVEEETLTMIFSHRIVFHPVETTFVNVDQDKIGQVINNFISNAVKYSPTGSTINIACVTMGRNAQVSVSDEGMGISSHDIDKLFDRYYRVEGQQMKSISGFGIGLYLCKEIIERHDGRIWVESELGKGSTFHFSLPLA